MNLIKHDNCFNVIWLLSQLLRVDVGYDELKLQLMGHPDYPSLLAISDTCRKLKVETLALKGKKGLLDEYPLPLIAEVREKNTNYFMVVKSVSGNQVVCSHYHAPRWIPVPRNHFLEIWSGTVLLVESTHKTSVPKSYFNWLKSIPSNSMYIAFLLGLNTLLVFITLSQLLQQKMELPIAAFCLTQLIGLFVCFLLIIAEIDNKIPLFQKICGLGGSSQCSNIQNTPKAKLLGLVGWDIIGWSFFAGNLSFLRLYGNDNITLICLKWVSIASLIFVPYSLYLQRKMGKWCRLCLMVLLTLFLAAVSVTFISQTQVFPLFSKFANLTLFYILCLCLIQLTRSLHKLNLEVFQSKVALLRIKRNERLFQALLSIQSGTLTMPDESLGISMGSPNARYKIVKVCSLYCAPCAESYNEINKWLLQQYNVHVQIIFTTKNEKTDRSYSPTKRLMALCRNASNDSFNGYLQDWYTKGRFDLPGFLSRHTCPQEEDIIDLQIEQMHLWCRTNKIQYTPTYFVNGYKLPQNYHLKDLHHFLLP